MKVLRGWLEESVKYNIKTSLVFFYILNTFSLHSTKYFSPHLSFLQGDKLYPMLGLSCFAYLLLVEEIEDMNFPAVFRYNIL